MEDGQVLGLEVWMQKLSYPLTNKELASEVKYIQSGKGK